jgi:antitoxin VapB
MTAARTKTFKSGNSEAVRLPKDIAFGLDVELIAVRSGDVLTLYPVRTSVAEMLIELEGLPTPPDVESRDEQELPEPDRL